MGYKREKKVYKLVWPPDDDLHGLVVRTRSVSLGQMLDIIRMATNADRGDFSEAEKLFQEFAGVLVSWNLEDDEGAAVPASLEGLKGQDIEFVMKLVMSWQGAVAGVSADLGKGSNSGGDSLEASLPMAPLSQSQAS